MQKDHLNRIERVEEVYHLADILAGRFFLPFHIDDSPSVVGTAGGTSMMGLFRAVALWANIQRRWFQGIMA